MMIFKRRVSAGGIAGYYWVYFVEEGDVDIEIGRTSWNNFNTLLGAVNFYEEGLVDAFKFFLPDTNIEVVTV